MLEIFQKNKEIEPLFANYDDLFNHITERENLKLFEEHSDFGKTEWSFVVFSPKNVSILYHHIKKESITQPLQQAYENQMSLIEICKGDYENPTQILGTPDIDIEELKKNWSLDYCKAHKSSFKGTVIGMDA